MPKSKKPSDQRLREPLPSLDDQVDKSVDQQNEKPTDQKSDTTKHQQTDTSKSRQPDTSTSRSNDTSTSRPRPDDEAKPSASRFQQQLRMLMEEVDIPADSPRMTEKTNAHISADTDGRLREAVRVLEMRYGKGFSKSLLVDYILRGALWDLRERAEESQVVQVLDQVFDSE